MSLINTLTSVVIIINILSFIATFIIAYEDSDVFFYKDYINYIPGIKIYHVLLIILGFVGIVSSIVLMSVGYILYKFLIIDVRSFLPKKIRRLKMLTKKDCLELKCVCALCKGCLLLCGDLECYALFHKEKCAMYDKIKKEIKERDV